MENSINTNDFMWAKLTRFPPWPSVVVEPSQDAPKKPNPGMHWMYFFGSHNYAWVKDIHLKPYRKFRDKFTFQYKTIEFKKAVAEIDGLLHELEKNPNYSWSIQPFKKKVASKRLKPPKTASLMKRPKQTLHQVASAELRKSPPQYDLSYDVISTRHIRTSDLTFGVLGIGIIGRRIVKNLIRSGHKVNIWNRTTQRCIEIETELQLDLSESEQLKTFLSPRVLMQNSDIVLNCVSDSDVSKKIIQDYFGINNSSDKILKEKGFVEMTSIDPETSKDIRDMIEMKGGRYLEAQIQGSRMEADEGKLVILTAGSRSLFFDCQSCFESIGKSAFFLGDVGYATKVNLILQLIKGICLVGLAEGFALAERSEISLTDFITAFKATNIANSYLSGKADVIVTKNFKEVEQSLQNMQKDMFLGLQLSNEVGQPMELASAANEIFKHCRRFDLSDKDASSIFMRTRF
ncbi:hypothetical protein NQ315_009684 [Exocentrus adspersus]|uniref:Cytokine-like nuclear factor N-PAC n=1 Tax=Exocentrus adspersus TaxID=1586481 RepID=A0AAV8WGZ6_9CUCU|nr:hypothetical protein NQ315_009684 [Exocentrus adspersus]